MAHDTVSLQSSHSDHRQNEVHRTEKKPPHFKITTTSTDLPPFLKNLLTIGAQEPIDFRITLDDKPDWLELEKFEKGQQFGKDNVVSLAFAELFATHMVYALRPVLFPFIFAGNIINPFKSFKRFVSTFLRINTWYKHDIWTDKTNVGRTNLRVARSYHENLHLKIRSSSKEKIMGNVCLKSEMNPVFEFLAKGMSEDVKSSCPANFKTDDLEFGINQMNMSLMQFTFVGLAVTYPEKMGIHYAKEEDFDAYVHTWRGLGYLLGIKDEYNFCNCDVKTLRKRTKDLIDLVIKPSFTDLSDQWEYIMRCIVAGSEFYSGKSEFEAFLMYLFEILEIDSAHLRQRMSYFQMCYFYVLKFFHGFVMKIPYFTKIFNKILIEVAEKKQKMERQVFKKIQCTNYPYVAKTN